MILFYEQKKTVFLLFLNKVFIFALHTISIVLN